MASDPTRVFLDASVLVAAAGSESGGSATAMKACRGKSFKAVLSTTVLLEARWNIAEKFGETALVMFYQLLAALGPEIAPHPSRENEARCMLLTGPKDAHVLAAALACDAAYLLTLDRRHLITPTIEAAELPIRVMTPGNFLRELVRRG